MIMPRLHAPPAAFTSSIFAATPAAITRISNVIFCPLFNIAQFSASETTQSSSTNFTPFPSNLLCTNAAPSQSRTDGKTRSARSTTVTLFTLCKIPSTHFSPINPAPITSTFLSFAIAASSASISSYVIKEYIFTFSAPSIFGIKGRDPVATRSLSYAIFLPSDSTTSFRLASIFSAVFPDKSVTPFRI